VGRVSTNRVHVREGADTAKFWLSFPNEASQDGNTNGDGRGVRGRGEKKAVEGGKGRNVRKVNTKITQRRNKKGCHTERPRLTVRAKVLGIVDWDEMKNPRKPSGWLILGQGRRWDREDISFQRGRERVKKNSKT